MRYKLSLEKRKKDGEIIIENVPIRIAVNHNGQRITLSTGYRIDAKAWDEKGQVVLQGYHNKQKEPYNIINSKLALQKSFLDNFSLKHQIERLEIDLEKLKVDFAEEFSRKKNVKHQEVEQELSFFELYDLFVKERGKQNDWMQPTYTKFKSLKKHLVNFDKKLHLDKLDEEKLTDLVEYLRKEGKMKNTTIKKQLGFLKWFLKWAVEKNHTNNNAYQGFKPKLKTADKQVIYLSSAELDLVRNYKIPESKQYLERVRDVFLFCCYTSLRYSDVYKLQKHDIKKGKIEIVTQKTTDKLSIKLNSKAIELIDKYKEFHFKDEKALPVISNQRMNDYLKELCELAQINEPVTAIDFVGNRRIENTYPKYSLVGTHTGRRTFICNALLNGMPAHAVMKITGHSDYKAMQPYIDIVSKDVDNMVDKYINF
ncbi:phage integrase SAM-like domain-containing protein [Carboxylicivirga mesophila]|uniref:Phage integrase SAM-like domain-containing protein n=2 Tax=Carboxylicivirga TaxID=1628153 RepID=A0A941IY18_9BACT|nr:MULTISPECIES: site-specific integrase [Carboxylicivirga]MBR8536098.1 phage integrase SAM-like domain-containing protein [Carboxylicivirga sediminis]MBS2210776.1 phage integrase SAM-like domain-containing protein [Carboxylicivirga mesophila]